MAIFNPLMARKKKTLTAQIREATLEGRAEGVSEKDGRSPAAAPSVDASGMRDALDALSAMYSGYLGSDRALLDEGFENLVGIIEVWRDSVPKA